MIRVALSTSILTGLLAVPAVAKAPLVNATSAAVTGTPGELVTAEVRLRIDDHHHIQANPAADDLLIPVTVDVTPSEAVNPMGVEYPSPKTYRLRGSDLELLVYGGEVTLLIRVAVAKDAQPGVHQLPTTIRYQACNGNTCLPPESVEIKTTINIQAAGENLARKRSLR